VGYKVSEVDAGNDLPKELVSSHQISYLMPCTVGMEKMDAFKGLFEWLELPYTHSGVQASALAMDKDTAKKIFKTENLPVAESICTSST
jgi:D-alanine-D-alanine ligase